MADGGAADGGSGDGGAVCTDTLEPNNSRQSAPSIAIRNYHDLRICPNDEDWHALDLRYGDLLSCSIFFQHASGDLELALLAPDGNVVLEQTSGTDNETFSNYFITATGTYWLHVYGYSGATNTYAMELSRSTGSTCNDDLMEPNDTMGTAHALSDGESSELFICAYNNDWYGISVSAGERVRVSLSFINRDGDLDLELYDSLGADYYLAAQSNSTADEEKVIYGPVSRSGILLARVMGYRGASNSYRITLDRSHYVDRREGSVSGIVRYEDRTLSTEGFTGNQYKPLKGADIELARSPDGYILARGVTMESGAYSFSYISYGSGALYLRVNASRRDSDVEVAVKNDQMGDAIYSVSSVTPLSGPVDRVDLDISVASGLGGAFNILAVVGQGYERLRDFGLVQQPAPLQVFWVSGLKRYCGSCYNNGTIWLGGGAEDEDEYDDHIILHELGHHVMNRYSHDDSPGGSHNGDRTNPLLAFSEGFATFFSSLVREDPLYIDVLATEIRVENLEFYPEQRAYGTSNGTMTGEVSEDLVSSVMWDLYDRGVEPWDDFSRNEVIVTSPVFKYIPGSSFADRGVRGVDFVDYLDGWFCLGYGAQSAVESIAITHREFPYDFAGPVNCPKPRAPLKVALKLLGIAAVGRDLPVRLTVTTEAPAPWLKLIFRLPPHLELMSGSLSRLVGPVFKGETHEFQVVVRPREAKAATLFGGGTLIYGKEARLPAAQALHLSLGPPPLRAQGRLGRDGSGRKIIEYRILK